jgi:hypothetical protein
MGISKNSSFTPLALPLLDIAIVAFDLALSSPIKVSLIQTKDFDGANMICF